MDRAEIQQKVIDTTVEHLGVDVKKVTDEARFDEDLEADSLDRVELTMAFEELFDIEISDEEGETILTVKDAIDHIESKLANR